MPSPAVAGTRAAPPGAGGPSPSRRRGGCAAAALAALAVLAAGASTAKVIRSAWRDTHPAREALVGRAGQGAYRGYVEVVFRAADGVALSGWWHPAANGAAVILVHGQHANREQLHAQAEPLARAGFGVLLFDLRAHGRSGGALSTWGDRERLDVAAAVRLALAQPGVRAVGAAGFSIGALALAGEAADDPAVAALVLEGMDPSAEDDVRSTYSAHGLLSELPALWVTEAQGVRLEDVRPGDRLGRLSPRPVLLVYGERDPIAPPSVGEALLRRLVGPAELWVVPGAGHGTIDRDPAAAEALGRRLVAFFTRALSAPVTPADDGRAAPEPSAARGSSEH